MTGRCSTSGSAIACCRAPSSWCRSPTRPLPAIASSSTERPDISSTSCRKSDRELLRDRDVTFVRRLFADDHAEKRRLAGAVRTYFRANCRMRGTPLYKPRSGLSIAHLCQDQERASALIDVDLPDSSGCNSDSLASEVPFVVRTNTVLLRIVFMRCRRIA